MSPENATFAWGVVVGWMTLSPLVFLGFALAKRAASGGDYED